MEKKTQKSEPAQDKKSYRPQSILDPNFKYVPAAATDVTQTWLRFGWKPTVAALDPWRKKQCG